MDKGEKMIISTTTKLIGSAGACIAVNLLLLALAIANSIMPAVYFASVIASVIVLMGLFYAITRAPKGARAMFQL